MRKIFKSIFSKLLIPLAKWYLKKERSYGRDGVRITVLPGVFHPGLFSSTKFLWEFLRKQDLRGRSLLELGCGSGFLSVSAAKAGARVTASDVSTKAINNVKINAFANNVSLTIVESDLFDNIKLEAFDWIIINPPYYAGSPKNEDELAWYCGDNFEYFHGLFSNIKKYIHKNSMIIMVLTKGCDLKRIFSIAHDFGFDFHLLHEKNVLFDEKDFLYRIRLVNSFETTQV